MISTKLTLFIPNLLPPKLATRISPSSDPLNIRGASRPTQAGRIRRNAVSSSARPNTPPVTTVKALDVWREFVKKRWNADTGFLNLEASITITLDCALSDRLLQRMVEDELLRKNNLAPPGAPGASAREAAVIFKLASQLKPEVRFISA